jgi:CRP-like cAMP-binding protein
VELFAPQRGAVAIDTYGEGDVLGWSWLIPPYHWRFDARAIEPTRAISLDARCMRTKCENDHDLGYELMKRFARIIEQRLDATRWQLLDVYGVRS